MDRVKTLSTHFFDHEIPNGDAPAAKKVDPSQRVLRW